ncbi:MAG: hypothetical protein ABIF17_02415, partial [Patescibacteria group bacterium]
MWAECDYQVENNLDNEMDTAPPSKDCIIKGNVSRKGYGNVYMLPGCPNYISVKIDPRKGDKYFCIEQEALDSGFRKSTNCP